MSKRGAVDILKVSSKSNPNSVAGALAGAVRQSGSVEVQVVGAGALNQAVKAVAIARGYVVADGIELICIPAFTEIQIDGESRTAIRLLIEQRPLAAVIPVETALDVVTLDVTDEALAVAAEGSAIA